jgi:hypothetical protein
MMNSEFATEKGDRHDVVTNNWSYVMARTYRRKRERHEYYWVLHDWESRLPYGYWVQTRPPIQSRAQGYCAFSFRQDGHHGRVCTALVPQGVRSPDSHWQQPHAAALAG